MTINDTVICKDNKKFKIVSELGSGGQGEVFVVKELDTDKKFAFKIIKEKNEKKKKLKMENIRNLHRRGSILRLQLDRKNFFVALPLHLYEKNGEFGYVMELCCGKSINSMMVEKQFDNMPMKKRLTIVRQMAESADWFRSNGLCYQDFSHKNFMYDDSANGTVSVIDCDNVTPTSASQSFAGGTGFYAAPEVAFGVCKPSVESDSYAIACLFFKIMTGSTDSPYHGRELYILFNGFMPSDMFEAAEFTKGDPSFGLDWLVFVFDPKNDVNKIDPMMFKKPEFQQRQKMILDNWAKVPDSMKELFCRAFYDPLNPQSHKNRPSTLDWMHKAQGDPESKRTNPAPFKKTSVTPSTPAPKSVSAPAPAAKNSPSVTFVSNKHVVELKAPLTLDAKTSNDAIAREMGVIEKGADGFVFRSSSVYTVNYYCKNSVSGTLRKGQTVALKDGMELFWAMRPSDRVRISLN